MYIQYLFFGLPYLLPIQQEVEFYSLYRHNGRWKHLERPLGSHLEKNILLLSWQQNGGNSSLWPLNTLSPWSPAPLTPNSGSLGPSVPRAFYIGIGEDDNICIWKIFSRIWAKNGWTLHWPLWPMVPSPWPLVPGPPSPLALWPPWPSCTLAPLAPLFHRPCCINLAFKENPHQ